MWGIGNHVWVIDTILGQVREGTIIKIRVEERVEVYTVEADKYWTINAVEGMIFNNRKDAVAALQRKLMAKVKETKKMLKNIK